MEILLSLAIFTFVTSATPGPNNILLLASGVRFGFLPTLPHILGIQFGIGVQLLLGAYGGGVMLMSLPGAELLLKLGGSGYLLYLAFNLRSFVTASANETSVNDRKAVTKGSSAKPFSFMQAAMFQFVNPKAWMMSVTASTLFLPSLGSRISSVLLMCLVFNCVGGVASGSWAVIGVLIKKFLDQALWQAVFTYLMMALTFITVLTIWL